MKMQLQNDFVYIVVGYHSRAPMMTKQPYRCLTLISCSSILLSTKVSNKAHWFGQYRALWKLLQIEITLRNWSGLVDTRVRWVVKILTWGTKLASFYQKHECDSRKLLYFVNRHSVRYFKFWRFEFSKSIFYVKNHLYLSKNNFSFVF